jgi:hypothetical protein
MHASHDAFERMLVNGLRVRATKDSDFRGWLPFGKDSGDTVLRLCEGRTP